MDKTLICKKSYLFLQNDTAKELECIFGKLI